MRLETDKKLDDEIWNVATYARGNKKGEYVYVCVCLQVWRALGRISILVLILIHNICTKIDFNGICHIFKVFPYSTWHVWWKWCKMKLFTQTGPPLLHCFRREYPIRLRTRVRNRKGLRISIDEPDLSCQSYFTFSTISFVSISSLVTWVLILLTITNKGNILSLLKIIFQSLLQHEQASDTKHHTITLFSLILCSMNPQ